MEYSLQTLPVTAKTIALGEFLEREKEYVLEQWQKRDFVTIVLHNHNIEASFFVKHFGKKILGYFIEVLKGESPAGSCPAIIALLMFFKQKSIKLNEVFFCCAAFKNVVITTVIDKEGGIDVDTLDIISFVFDLNFSGVIEEYLKKQYCKISPKAKKKEAVTQPEVTPVLHKAPPLQSAPPSQVYDSEYEQEDIDELIDLENDIIVVSDQLNFGRVDHEMIMLLAEKLSKYGGIMLTNHDFEKIGNSVIHLAHSIGKETNHQFVFHNISVLMAFVDCFINDLILWRKGLLDTDIENPHYYDKSILSNVEQIIQMIEGKTDIDEGEGFEFF